MMDDSVRSERTLQVVLENACRPMKAVELADEIGLVGSREKVRREIRERVKGLRDSGPTRFQNRAVPGRKMMICSSISDGYWLARTPTEYAMWQHAERTKQVFRFAQMRDNRVAVSDAFCGQANLFDVGTDKGAFSK